MKRDEFEATRQREEEEADARSLWFVRRESTTWDSCLQSLRCWDYGRTSLRTLPVSPQAASPKLHV